MSEVEPQQINMFRTVIDRLDSNGGYLDVITALGENSYVGVLDVDGETDDYGIWLGIPGGFVHRMLFEIERNDGLLGRSHSMRLTLPIRDEYGNKTDLLVINYRKSPVGESVDWASDPGGVVQTEWDGKDRELFKTLEDLVSLSFDLKQYAFEQVSSATPVFVTGREVQSLTEIQVVVGESATTVMVGEEI